MGYMTKNIKLNQKVKLLKHQLSNSKSYNKHMNTLLKNSIMKDITEIKNPYDSSNKKFVNYHIGFEQLRENIIDLFK